MFLVESRPGWHLPDRGVPEEEISGVLAVACPEHLFPYVRETVSDVVNRAGFPPVCCRRSISRRCMPSKWPNNPAMRTKARFGPGPLLAAASAQALEFRSAVVASAPSCTGAVGQPRKLYVLSQGYRWKSSAASRTGCACAKRRWRRGLDAHRQPEQSAHRGGHRQPRRAAPQPGRQRQPWPSRWIKTWCCRWSEPPKTAGSSCATPMAAVAMARFRRSGGCKQS